ncbi:histidine phosphatase family protein [Actinomycetaceae bacterium WB03_NA08]|uniref:Histidine phosphatase family protein n=2 Tax=Scrofimicrobium canadense TaxID=2652290 RepID=A0A6N7W3F2_9ACTO|nr:histidine phosphatase family protein [Scrofimicrobium canadense]
MIHRIQRACRQSLSYPEDMSRHTVIFIRHAKAAQSSATGDSGRALTDEGKEQAQQLGKKLTATLAKVDKIFLSPATRAIETWEQMTQGAGLSTGDLPNPQQDPVIYAGEPHAILDMVRAQGDGETVVVVGHEPTISEVARLSVKDDVEVPAGIPTASAIIISASHDWKEWHSHVATTAEFIH